MEYYDSNNKTSIYTALAAVGLYVAAIGTLLFCVNFTMNTEPPFDEGILVEFGTTDEGLGEEELLATDTEAPTPPQEKVVEQEPPMTDDRSDEEIETPREIEEPQETKPMESETPQKVDSIVEEKRTINKKALYRGRKEDSTSKSSGTNTNTTQGNQGKESGSNNGSTETLGKGIAGVAELKDRSLVDDLPTPSYPANNVSGKVVIYIIVDDSGRVTHADFQSKGSTTNNAQLKAAAIAAAYKARFTDSDSIIQEGTITYVFNLN